MVYIASYSIIHVQQVKFVNCYNIRMERMSFRKINNCYLEHRFTLIRELNLIVWKSTSRDIITLRHGYPSFLWQRATPVIACWFAGCTWTNNGKWYKKRLKLLCNFYSACIIYKRGRGPQNTSWQPVCRPQAADWRPML